MRIHIPQLQTKLRAPQSTMLWAISETQLGFQMKSSAGNHACANYRPVVNSGSLQGRVTGQYPSRGT